MPEPTNTPTDPDLVDRIFAYLLETFPELDGPGVAAAKRAVRSTFGGEEHYIASRSQAERAELVAATLAHFNGRNATEVARRLGIGRATVYRLIKQAGRASKIVSVSPVSETDAALRSPTRATRNAKSRKPQQDPAWPSPSLISTPSTAPSQAVSSPSSTTAAKSPIAQ